MTLEERHLEERHLEDAKRAGSLHVLPPVDPNLITNLENLPQTVVDLSQTFLLHSNPGAAHTIYLDFDGQITSGTIWNIYDNGGADIITPAYDFDGKVDSFSNEELERIQYIWQRVAEDFIPFDVNVTTEDPGVEALTKTDNNDPEWGVRVVIGGDGSWFASAGGVAYLDSFNWNSDTPAFVFEDNLGNGHEKYTAEAISHEVGHTLFLDHDGAYPNTEYYEGHGSGATGWASIMGVGYYQPLVQWSKGEYVDANNTEDDLQIITTNNGFGYRIDDRGNSTATATPLTVSGNNISGSGIIEKNTDADFFSFNTGAGLVYINILPFDRSPNLDILAKLYDNAGNLVASSNPVDALNASFSLNLAAGDYYVKVNGTGKSGNDGYTKYGSLGQYSIQGTIVGEEAIVGTENNDTLNGTAGNDVILGLGGNDRLNGQAGLDILDGGNGNDLLDGGLGDDGMQGGQGNDTYIVNSPNDTVGENPGEGNDLIKSSVSYTLPPNVERLLLTGSANIRATGNILNNTITGNKGENTLVGEGGNDKLQGTGGYDILIGGPGNDKLTGGSDTYDDFVFNSPSEGVDTIYDYDPTTAEWIVINVNGFGGGLVAGYYLASDQFVEGIAATDSNHRFIYQTQALNGNPLTNGNLFYDSDGTGPASKVKIATLIGAPELVAGDYGNIVTTGDNYGLSNIAQMSEMREAIF